MGRGNITPEMQQKARLMFQRYVISSDTPGFGRDIGRRIRVADLFASLPKQKATAVCETVVEQDMLNITQGVLHTGCSAYLIDMCTALPYITLGLAEEKHEDPKGNTSAFAMASFAPSQRLDITYHHPARLGARLRIIGEAVVNVGSLLTVRGEIWDVDLDRLVASAVHMKVMPQKPPLAATQKGKL